MSTVQEGMKTLYDKFYQDLLEYSMTHKVIFYDNCEMIFDEDGEVWAELTVGQCKYQCGGECSDCYQLVSLV